MIMNFPAKIISLLLLLPITLSKCDCTVDHGVVDAYYKHFNWDERNEFDQFYERIMGNILQCKDVSLDGRNPLKSIIKSADDVTARQANHIAIINSSVPVVESAIFDSFRSTLKVSLDNDGIVDIQPNSFADMINLTTINIINNKLTRIKGEALSGVPKLRVLNLYNNKIDTLININEITTLEVLNISYNLITKVDERDFQKLQSLKTLDLSGNDILHIDSKIFANLNSLTNLYLNNNTLQEFNIVHFVQPISYLDLSSNVISDIDINNNQTFTIYNLNYSDNNLYTLKAGQFKNLAKLSSLNLSNNLIRNIDVDAFVTLSNLTSLSLSENMISTIYVGTFHQLSALQILNLSWNDLDSLENGIFTGLNNLEVLDLSENLFQTINEHIFYPTRGIEEIYLHGNLLENYDVSSLTNYMKSLKHISVNFKQIGCESLIYAMRRLRSDEVEVRQGHHVKGHNVHGIACDPELLDSHRSRFENMEEKMLQIISYFPVVLNIFIVLVVFSIIFLIIKTLFMFNINFDYCRRKFFNKDSDSRSLTRLSENDRD